MANGNNNVTKLTTWLPVVTVLLMLVGAVQYFFLPIDTRVSVIERTLQQHVGPTGKGHPHTVLIRIDEILNRLERIENELRNR